MLDPESCWKAVSERDRQLDGRLYYGVITTGVFCRPSCPSKRPSRENVRFFASADEARRAGLRPCRRCLPNSPALTNPAAKKVQEACQFIRRHADEQVSLRELATRAGLSPFHFQRTFKAVAGVTPKEYAAACRLDDLKTRLKRGSAVTAAIYDAGYGSSSRLYERAGNRLGMTPRQFGRGGAGVSMSYACAPTPFGLMMIAATDRGLCSVQFGEDDDNLLSSLRAQYPNAAIERMRTPFPQEFGDWMKALVRHLEAHGPQPAVPLDVRASAFQMRVWKFLQSIPRGEVRTYTEVAAGIGQPSAARAVARACATNPVAIVVPCHRVIRGSGALAGYRWGLERKKLLIEAERAQSRAADATIPA